MDADPDDYFSYRLVDGEGSENNDYFSIRGANLHAEYRFNYEERSEYSIRIRSTDQKGGWVEKCFAIEVLDLNDMPVANPDSLYLVPGVPNIIPTSVLLANDYDEDGSVLTVVSVLRPHDGSVVLEGDQVIFTPAENYQGIPSFEYVISDGFYQAVGIARFDQIYKIMLPMIYNPR